MHDKYRGTKEYFLILAELIQAARYRGTVTYQELADWQWCSETSSARTASLLTPTSAPENRETDG